MILRYVQERNGLYRYRRRIPPHLKDYLGKGEVVLPLGRTQDDIAARCGAAQAKVDPLLQEAEVIVSGLTYQNHLSPFKNMNA